jgi:hypothetical protein
VFSDERYLVFVLLLSQAGQILSGSSVIALWWGEKFVQYFHSCLYFSLPHFNMLSPQSKKESLFGNLTHLSVRPSVDDLVSATGYFVGV